MQAGPVPRTLCGRAGIPATESQHRGSHERVACGAKVGLPGTSRDFQRTHKSMEKSVFPPLSERNRARPTLHLVCVGRRGTHVTLDIHMSLVVPTVKRDVDHV